MTRRHGSRVLRLVLTGVIGFAPLLGCRRAAPPNLLLVTLDTTRADRVGCYGYREAHTPTLDRLASEGALFEDATTTAPSTLPAHASILTGRFPPAHGARNNGNDVRLKEGLSIGQERARRRVYRKGLDDGIRTGGGESVE
jgi:hypothetical protein